MTTPPCSSRTSGGAGGSWCARRPPGRPVMQQLRPPGDPGTSGCCWRTRRSTSSLAGAALCGATVVGINPTRRGAELAADIRRTDCAMIVTDEAYGDLLDGIGHGVPRVLDAGGAEYAGCGRAPRRGGRGDGGGPRSAVRAAPAVHLRVHRDVEGRDLLHRPVGVHLPRSTRSRSPRRTWTTTHADLPRQRADGAVGPAWRTARRARCAAKFSASGFLPDISCSAQPSSPTSAGAGLPHGQPERRRNRQPAASSASAPRPRPRTRWSSRVGTAPAPGALRLVRGRRLHHCTPETPEGALGVPQQGFTVETSAPAARLPPARFDAHGRMLNPEEAIGEMVSRGAEARFEGYYKNPGASQEGCGTAASGPATSATGTKTASTGSPGARRTGCGWIRRTSRPCRSSGS